MKRSLVRLVIAVASFLAALVELALRLVQLAIMLVERATRKLEGGTRRLAVEAPAPKVARLTLVAAPAPPAVDDVEERLIGALSGPSLGYKAGKVRAFVATVRPRMHTEPIDVLVREGIARLSAAS
jgi:hypothetical protein